MSALDKSPLPLGEGQGEGGPLSANTLLTDNLPLLAGAPNGIKKLRELILELAVRGKLVGQDASDEPASELLKRIAAEKARLVAEGKIKKQKQLTEIAEEERPFAIPANWEWCRLADLVNVLNGRAYKKEELIDSGTPVLRVGNLFTSKHWYYSDLTLEEEKYCNPGDLLFAWSASFGPFIWAGERSIYHYHIWKLDLYGAPSLYMQYLYTFLLEQTQKIKASGHGVAMIHMTKEKMEKLLVPAPPLAEQHRIVAKVDELMALCDRLEAQQADASSAHAQLVQALLGSLTQASDATEFAANWQRLAEHFHTLFSTEPSIDALKQTLLQLAVMGKLVPQDPSDEPASELMKQIADEKARLVADGSIKKQKQLPGVTQEETPSAVPAGWCWVRMGEVGETNIGLTYSPSDVGDIGIPVLRSSNVQKGQIDLSDLVRVDMPVKDSVLVQEGDLLICARNGSKALVGKTAMISNLKEPMAFGAFMAIFRSKLNPYLLRFINSPLFRKVIDDVNTTTINQITQNNLRTTLLPLPPLAEQHRIVVKVDQLMALCDQLKTQLTQARQLNEQLASTLVEQAVA